MSIYLWNDHLYKLKASKQELRLESLHIQYQFLDVLCNRHQVWAKDITNPEAAQMHGRIADLMQEATTMIDYILDIYQQNNNHHL